jgi:hypothetical protein
MNSPIYDVKMFYRPLTPNEVWNSYFYDYLKENKFIPLSALEVQDSGDRVASGGAVCAGDSDVTCEYTDEGSGGAVCAGDADVFVTNANGNVYDEFGSGGAVLDGSASVKVIRRLTASGGAVLAGSATTIRVIHNITASGGAVLAGMAVRACRYFITATGGGVVTGGTPASFNDVATGGASVGGAIVLKRGTLAPKRQSECFDARVCRIRIQQIGSLKRRVFLEDQCRRPFRLWDAYVPGVASCAAETEFSRILKVQTAVGYRNPHDRGKLPNSNVGDVR